MQDIKRYRDFSSYIKNYFGTRVQKVSIDTGFTVQILMEQKVKVVVLIVIIIHLTQNIVNRSKV